MAFDVGAKKGAVSPNINVTPLVDVVLVLLIIFMVITPMLTKQMWIQVPEKPKDLQVPPPDDGEPPVTLRLSAAGKLFVGPEEVSKKDLAQKLKRVFAARNDRLLFFDADDRVTHGEALAALDLARSSGPWTLIVLPQPLPQ